MENMKRVGRPKLEESRRLTSAVLVRVLPSEKDTFAEKAFRDGVSLSCWMRRLGLMEVDRDGSSQAG